VSGSSPVTAVFGLIILLGFLMLASQALVHLHASTIVGAAAFDGARSGASDGYGCAEAVARVRQRLAGQNDVQVACHDDGTSTRVMVRVPSPARVLGRLLRIEWIDRGSTVRTERIR
jgi:hypothetical protein